MRIVAISDTHGKHNLLQLPKGEMIIHAGDISAEGSEGEVRNFLRWFAKLDFKYKIFIAGNHDFFFDGETNNYLAKVIPTGIIYLNDSGVTIEGFSFWGSPVTPWLYDGAFNRTRGSNISKHWKLIPPSTDVLITHGPAYGILDKNKVNFSAGCKSLKKIILSIQPKIHVFGHIHESYGKRILGNTTFLNACNLIDTDDNSTINQPIIIDLL